MPPPVTTAQLVARLVSQKVNAKPAQRLPLVLLVHHLALHALPFPAAVNAYRITTS